MPPQAPRQGWVDEVIDDVDACIDAALAMAEERRSAQHRLPRQRGGPVGAPRRTRNIKVDLGSDQTSLHNPWAGGYYPVGLSYEESNASWCADPAAFKQRVQETLRRHVKAVNTSPSRACTSSTTATPSCWRASARARRSVGTDGEIRASEFSYPSYVEDIMGPMCFDHGFGPFRWVCTSGDPKDLATSDRIAGDVLEAMLKEAPTEIASRSLTTCTGSAARSRTSSWWAARRASSTPTAKAASASPQAFNRPSRGRDQRAHRAGPRPPRRERHRQPVPRDQQHPRRQPLHRRHGRAELRRRCLPRRHLDQLAQRWRRGLGRSDQRRLRHGARRQRRQRPPPEEHAALGREQRHRAPRLGPQPERGVEHRTGNEAHPTC
jgi:hypothetical protein